MVFFCRCGGALNVESSSITYDRKSSMDLQGTAGCVYIAEFELFLRSSGLDVADVLIDNKPPTNKKRTLN